MHACENYKARLLPCLFLWLLAGLSPLLAQAENYSAEVKTADITVQNGWYVLSADIDYRLSPKALDALQNGVPLFWAVRIKIRQPRDFFWDNTLVETALRYRLQYHALLNMYRVRNENNDAVHNFSTLSAALDAMSRLRDLPLINKDAVASENAAVAKVKVYFDRDALPLPLRPVAYINQQWYLSSSWTTWPLKR